MFQFGEFQIDVLARTLRREEEIVTLNRRALDVLLHLVQNPGRVLTRDELLKNVWPDGHRTARLALAEIEMKSGQTTAGRAHLTAIEADAKTKGHNLIARKAVIARG